MMNDIIRQIDALGVVPVLVIDRVEDAVPLGEALIKGGMPVAEVTMRTPAALDAIRAMSTLDGILVGAGTVLSADHVDQAVAAGAAFIVSPGLDAGVVDAARRHSVSVIPGIMTASEIQKAYNMGLKLVKFFPANIAGGAAALKGFSAVFTDMRFMPTGGVTTDNLAEYLTLPSVQACGGSWIAPASLLQSGNYDEISARAAKAVAAAKEIKGEYQWPVS